VNKKLLAAYAAISSVYLIYTPYALPVLDDWTVLQIFHNARQKGAGRALLFLFELPDNRWWVQFRIFWASFVPIYLLSFAADFAAWVYFLFAWIIHLLTAYLLWRVVLALSRNSEAAFAAGAIYSVFPAGNNAIFCSISNAHYYIQGFLLLAWFWFTWKKLVEQGDLDYGWKDFAVLLPVVFAGEQILPALAALLPVSLWLAGKPAMRRMYLRFCCFHWTAMAVLLFGYVFAVNKIPVLAGFQSRYQGAPPWSIRPAAWHLFSSLGWQAASFGWRADWRFDPVLAALLVIAASLTFRGTRQSTQPERNKQLALWAIPGLLLGYVPVARLGTFEWRYLAVLSIFLAALSAAALAVIPGPWRAILAVAAVGYCLSQTYFEMRQCWIPQSREAQAMLDAVARARPFASHDVVVFSGDTIVRGFAPSFINGASWSMAGMLERYGGADHLRGGRSLIVYDQGETGVFRSDSVEWLHHEDLNRLRVFTREASGRFEPKSLLALPVGKDRYLLRLTRLSGSHDIPSEALTVAELRALPFFGDVYLARRANDHMHPSHF